MLLAVGDDRGGGRGANSRNRLKGAGIGDVDIDRTGGDRFIGSAVDRGDPNFADHRHIDALAIGDSGGKVDAVEISVEQRSPGRVDRILNPPTSGADDEAGSLHSAGHVHDNLGSGGSGVIGLGCRYEWNRRGDFGRDRNRQAVFNRWVGLGEHAPTDKGRSGESGDDPDEMSWWTRESAPEGNDMFSPTLVEGTGIGFA